MNNNDHPINNFHGAGWQVLGKLELPLGTNGNDAIHSWLTELLIPLHLRADFLNKIVTSAQDAAARLLQVENVKKFEHIHILLYIPQERVSKGYSWGFFRIEKIENTGEDSIQGAHAVEFYLYTEGRESD